MLSFDKKGGRVQGFRFLWGEGLQGDLFPYFKGAGFFYFLETRFDFFRGLVGGRGFDFTFFQGKGFYLVLFILGRLLFRGEDFYFSS